MPQEGNVPSSNSTSSDPSVFFLTGIPGLEDMHLWISIPFSSVFAIILLGNCTLLYVIRTEPSLHKPMFYFLAMLAVVNLVLSTTTVPKILSIFWFNSREINFSACLVQMFFIHSFSMMESALLLAMAFDRYVAICNPLRYATILTNSVIVKIGLAALVRAVVLMAPLPFLVRRLPFCQSHVIAHCACDHMAVAKLACADTRINSIYGIIIAFFIVGLDLMFIALSYVKIIRTVLSLASKEEQLKAFGTCVSHLFAILVVYLPGVLSSVIHRFGEQIAPYVHILLGTFYLLFPPMMNPIVYGVKTKQIRDRVCLIFQGKSI
ncbi:olfactory receptor 52K1-like [Pelodiscus sinensis]|uniref:olfactory receptor 52K1-like n=1 Tax=Pelodiscus sinensis TaxID=13735 RepID=UPI0003C47D42|nr:olfactory receptor 52K1-like [Pelodiscus sinensis]|eukprot:XP_006126626.1 olfactory receptor 52K1-like [Pelodiscus sinensis]